MEFRQSIMGRRSFYGISKELPFSDEALVELVNHGVQYTPSAFHCQSQKIALLLGEKHDILWNIVKETLRKRVSPENFAPVEEKINSFKNGHGTVLYFNDDSITKSLQDAMPSYSDNFPIWAEQANGMLQFTIWNMLEEQGAGASLQHYNPIISEEVTKTFALPASWRLVAQMPFGTPTAQPQEKEFVPTEERVKVFY